MNKRSIVLTIAAVFLLFATAAFAAESAEPGSADDPVVTKSYVDARIAELKSDADGGSSAVFGAVSVEKGKKLIGGGGTELILRSGSAAAIDNGADGLSDLTAGKDLKGGAPVTKNHLLLVPRDDGRGILAQSDIWIMVKGAYTIK